jgi:hypothetical protein
MTLKAANLTVASVLAAIATAALWSGATRAADDPDQPPPPAWSFSHQDGDAMMIFGVPAEWEGSPYSLGCSDRSGKVELGFWVDHQVNPGDVGGEEATRLTVRSGSEEATFDARAQDEQMNGGVEISATAPADSPVLAEFARTGVIQMAAYGKSSDMPPANAADAAKLIQACRTAR